MTKFYEKNFSQRLKEAVPDPKLQELFLQHADLAHDKVIENYLTDLPVPVGLLRQLVVDGHTYLVPMATEEPSVVAAANNGARFLTNIETVYQTHLRFGQILVMGDFDTLDAVYLKHKDDLKKTAQLVYPSIVARGGGLKELHFRQMDANSFSFDALIDTQDAMGANIVNTIVEAIAEQLRSWQVDVLAAIVSNLPTTSMTEMKAVASGLDLPSMKKIAALSHFATIDFHRAATDNKGFLNGASAVVLASGNDWRAFEAGAHAYAAIDGNYKSLASWTINSQNQLIGRVKMPVQLGIVGGTISQNKVAVGLLKLTQVHSADELARIVLAAGLAQSLAALRALVGEGIQKGHMKMQRRAKGEDK
ncbi:hydroxymethylglutaryl-CoA reductase, degradative [Oenococcus sp.]|uniref:hydroxymethylglutaryl-CoA reductase, degradative n=1 Tax=Oenococcus sp. TaxID=1979414 RepID=UPI0039EA0C8E